MKSILLVASTIFASAQCGVINARQRPITSRPVPGGGGDGTQTFPSSFYVSFGPPTATVTFWPNPPPGGDLGKCGLDAFEGHTAEASLFCSSILRGGTATSTETYTSRRTTTVSRTITTTISYGGPTRSSTRPTPSPTPTSRTPTPTPTPTSRTPTPTPTPPSSTRTPTPTPPSSTRTPTPTPPSSTVSSPSPTPTSTGCGLVGYVKSTQAYYFDSTGTKSTFAACSAFCKAEEKCKGFGYGEANCLLFDIQVNDNVNYNPMSPYTFYNKDCPVELPVKAKRQVQISLSVGGPKDITSACQCLITSAPGATTVKTTVTVTSDRVTVTQTATRTVTRGGDDDDDWRKKQ